MNCGREKRVVLSHHGLTDAQLSVGHGSGVAKNIYVVKARHVVNSDEVVMGTLVIIKQKQSAAYRVL